MEAFSASIDYDSRLYRYDIAGSKAHATMLADNGLLSKGELKAIIDGLSVIEKEIDEELLTADVEQHLPPDEREPRPELQQELGDVLDQRPLDLVMASGCVHATKCDSQDAHAPSRQLVICFTNAFSPTVVEWLLSFVDPHELGHLKNLIDSSFGECNTIGLFQVVQQNLQTVDGGNSLKTLPGRAMQRRHSFPLRSKWNLANPWHLRFEQLFCIA